MSLEIRKMAMRTTAAFAVMTAVGVAVASAQSQAEVPAEIAAKMAKAKAEGKKKDKPEFPKFEDVSKDYKKIVSTADGKSLPSFTARPRRRRRARPRRSARDRPMPQPSSMPTG